MKTLLKLQIPYLALLLMAPGSAFGVDPNMAAVQAAIGNYPKQDPQCTDPMYQKDPSAKQNCQSCQEAVKNMREQTKNVAGQGSTVIASQQAGAVVGTSAAAAAANNQKTGVSSGSGANNTGSNTSNAQSGVMKQLSSNFSKCTSEIENKCKDPLAQADKQIGDQATQACQGAQQAADRGAADKASNGSGMEDLSKLLGAAAQGLGPLAQMLNKPSEPVAKDQSAQTPQMGASARQAIENGSLTNPTIGVGTGTSTDASLKPMGSGAGAYSAASRDYGSDAAGLSSSELPKTSAANGSESKTTASGGGGAGSMSSTGASKMPEEAAEIPKNLLGDGESMGGMGGGGGSRPMLGLKGKSAELDPIFDPAAAKADGLGDLGGRDLASSEEGNGEGLSGDTDASLFIIIHSKIKDLKKRGSI